MARSLPGVPPEVTAPGARLARFESGLNVLAGSRGRVLVLSPGSAPGSEPVQQGSRPPALGAEHGQPRHDQEHSLKDGKEETYHSDDDERPARGQPEDSPDQLLSLLPQHPAPLVGSRCLSSPGRVESPCRFAAQIALVDQPGIPFEDLSETQAIAAAVVLALGVRAFVLAPYRVMGDCIGPEIPSGSHVLVYKLSRTFLPGDIVAYHYQDQTRLARVAQAGPGNRELVLQRNDAASEPLGAFEIVGRVVAAGVNAGGEEPEAAGRRLDRVGAAIEVLSQGVAQMQATSLDGYPQDVLARLVGVLESAGSKVDPDKDPPIFLQAQQQGVEDDVVAATGDPFERGTR